MDLPALRAAAEAAAFSGGDVVARAFGREPATVEAKGPGDYVSEVDLASEAAIRDSLAAAAPGIPFFGEERGGTRADLGWLVDPLDGTANFLHGFPVVGVSVALVEHGRPVVGVVHAPMLGLTFSAAAGHGAADQTGRRLAISTRAPAEAICATGFPFKVKHRLGRYQHAMVAALGTFEDLRRPGAACLDLAWTAAGVFDGFFELALGPWDIAAGALLVTEAGGVVTDWSGDPDAWLASGDILAGPPAVRDVLAGLAADSAHLEPGQGCRA